MTTSEIAHRLNAQTRGSRFLARCPAHDDRRPSLSLREGSGGRTLLHCFAGCSAEEIVAALGLEVSDLFADSASPSSGPVSSTIESAQAALDGALRIVLDREEQRQGFRPPALARLKNEARAAVERRFNVRLSRHSAPWWEVPPHDLDPEWLACVDRAIEELSFESELDADSMRSALPKSLDLQDDVLWRARCLQRDLAGVT
jgi:hypothetical protein